jgi:peroxiredoxin
MATVLLMARLILFGVFAVAGATKLADRTGSRQMLVAFGVPSVLAHPLSLVLPIAELIVAAALVPAASVRIAAVAAFSLLLIFMVAIGVNLARGRTPDCNCFGQLHAAPIGWSTLARNAALGLGAALLVWNGENAAFSIVAWLSALSTEQRLIVLVAGAALGLGFGAVLLMQMLRLDAPGDRPGIGVANAFPKAAPAGLLVGSPAPMFRLKGSDGRFMTLGDLISPAKPLLMIFTHPNCRACQALLPDIGQWQRAHGPSLRLVLLMEGPVAEIGEPGHHSVQVLFQRKREVSEAYQVRGTPSVVIVTPDGSIGSAVAEGADAIRALVAQTTKQSRPPREGANGSGAGPRKPGLRIGDPAPALTFRDLDGKPVALRDFEGSTTLVLFWKPSCGFCQRMLGSLKAWEIDRPAGAPTLLVISTGTVEENRAMKLGSRVVLDRGARANAAFAAYGTPMAVLIDGSGRIASELVIGAEAVMRLTRSEDLERSGSNEDEGAGGVGDGPGLQDIGGALASL